MTTTTLRTTNGDWIIETERDGYTILSPDGAVSCRVSTAESGRAQHATALAQWLGAEARCRALEDKIRQALALHDEQCFLAAQSVLKAAIEVR